jgi:hypothetical protein
MRALLASLGLVRTSRKNGVVLHMPLLLVAALCYTAAMVGCFFGSMM